MPKIEPDEPSFDPREWRPEDLEDHLARGIELFNAAEYEAAHEQFERAWLSTHGPEADFFKGLIQASIALHHFRRGNLDGAAKLHSGHRRHLAAYLPSHRGVAVDELLAAMQQAFRPVLRRRPGDSVEFDPALRPRIRRERP